MKGFPIMIKLIIILLIILFVLFAIFLLFSSVTNYKPPVSELIFNSETPNKIDIEKEINLFIWNIGYCGLSEDMDFFYDGGKQVRTTKVNVNNNMNVITDYISKNNNQSFILLQEVDISSRRSYYTNQFDSLENKLSDFYGFFAKNYDVKFVPTPINNPLGKVKSGLASFSEFIPSSVIRYSFPGNFSWPTSLYMLDRCFMVMRFATSNNKELLVINTHNSAYDDGSLKTKQMEYLKKFLIDEYEKGNYIIVGGDWNQNPPELAREDLQKNSPAKRFILNSVPENYLPSDWKWIYDSAIPTNRYLNIPYSETKSVKVTLDFFLISPNIENSFIKVQDLEFKNSDHQPVFCVVKLK